MLLTWNFQMALFGSAGLRWCTRGGPSGFVLESTLSTAGLHHCHKKKRCTVRISSLPLVNKATVRRNVLNMVHGQLSRVSESVTFGAVYICNAFQCREKSRDKPLPLSDEKCRDEPCSASVVDRSRYRKANVVVSPHAAVLPLISLGLAR